jgi:hypothetical protein
MRKGFGFYSPHESSSFFMKALLLSFWIGVDVLAALVLTTIPASMLLRHFLLFLGVSTVLAAGTVFSILFVWATGSLFGPRAPSAPKARNVLEATLQRVQREPFHLLCVGASGVAVCVFLAAVHLVLLDRAAESARQAGRADVVVAQKCAEVASLERQLFQSDQQVVLAQCLLQYDENYASLRKS